MNYSVEFNSVTKKIGNNLIIEDANFRLEKGKIYGLVGANGSGKSTLLKILLGLYKSKGTVSINGENLKNNYKGTLDKVGGIVDYVSFYEYLTAYENLRYFCLLYDVPLERVKEVLEIVKLSSDDKKQVKKFSLGMKQRLGIAIALLKDPDILVLDEPTNGLDPKGIKDLRNLLLELKNKTIIVSSHIISEIEKITNEIIFINKGKIYQKKLKNDDRHKVKFTLGNYDNLKMPSFALNENKTCYMSDEEVSKTVKELVDKNIQVYRIEEKDTLEDLLIKMMDGE